jgi:type VI secretion system protein VasD
VQALLLAILFSGRRENGIVRIFGLQCAAAVGVAVALVACAGGPPKPAQVTGSIQASPQINPTTGKRPSPLLVRVYELKSVAAFNAADFMSLYQRDQAELAADLVGKEEFVLAPGESKPYAKTLSPETRFLGVVAAFRDVEHSKWRSSVAIQPGQKQQVVIRAGELSVEASVTK